MQHFAGFLISFLVVSPIALGANLAQEYVNLNTISHLVQSQQETEHNYSATQKHVHKHTHGHHNHTADSESEDSSQETEHTHVITMNMNAETILPLFTLEVNGLSEEQQALANYSLAKPIGPVLSSPFRPPIA